ncbi:uncharacterized protein LOC144430394 [Styela clava]
MHNDDGTRIHFIKIFKLFELTNYFHIHLALKYLTRIKKMLIMENNRYILLLMFVRSFEFIQAKQCNIPEDDEDIDWNNFPDDWYLVLHTDDPVMDKSVFGAKLQNFTKTSTGMVKTVTELHKGSPPRTFPVHYNKKKAGIYRLEKSDEPAMIASQSLTPEGRTSEDTIKFDDALLNSDVLILSDEKNYQINVFCINSDEWVVRVVFPTMNPTINQLTLMWNKLMEKGINVQLHLLESVKHPENFMGFE